MMNSKYATPIEKVAEAIVGRLEFDSGDPIQDAMFCLAAAYYYTKQAETNGDALELSGRPIGLPTIEKAYRELAHVRKNSPYFITPSRHPYLTRLGRLIDG